MYFKAITITVGCTYIKVMNAKQNGCCGDICEYATRSCRERYKLLSVRYKMCVIFMQIQFFQSSLTAQPCKLQCVLLDTDRPFSLGLDFRPFIKCGFNYVPKELSSAAVVVCSPENITT